MKKGYKTVYKSTQKRKYPTQQGAWTEKIYQLINKYIWNKLVLAIAAGLIVGSVFGLTILHYVTNDGAKATMSEEQTIGQAVNSSPQVSDEHERLEVTVPDFYVIQIGLFHERENASMKKRQLQRRNIETFIWQRQDEYFLLHGPFSTQSKAQTANERLQAESVQSFVKEWQIIEPDIEVTTKEADYLDQYVQLWIQSLEQFEAEGHIPLEAWQLLMEKGNDSQLITDLQLSFRQLLADAKEEQLAFGILLQSIYEFEKVVKK